MRFQNEFGRSVATCVLSIYNLKLDRDCGQHSNSQSTYLCVLLRNQNWLKIGQLSSIARDLYFLTPNLKTQWSKIFKNFKVCTYCSKKFLVSLIRVTIGAGRPVYYVSTTPLRQWGFWQCLPFNWTTL